MCSQSECTLTFRQPVPKPGKAKGSGGQSFDLTDSLPHQTTNRVQKHAPSSYLPILYINLQDIYRRTERSKLDNFSPIVPSHKRRRPFLTLSNMGQIRRRIRREFVEDLVWPPDGGTKPKRLCAPVRHKFVCSPSDSFARFV